MRPQSGELLVVELEHEVGRKTFQVALDLLGNALGSSLSDQINDGIRAAKMEADQMRSGQEEAKINKEAWAAAQSSKINLMSESKPKSLVEAYAETYGFDVSDGVYYPSNDDAEYLDAGYVNDYKKKSLWDQINKNRTSQDQLIPYPKDYNVSEPKTWVAKGDEIDPVFVIGAGDPLRRSDVGSGLWNVQSATLASRMEKQSILSALNGVDVIWPDAVAQMRHYLENTGGDLIVNLQRIVETTAAGRDLYINQRNAAIQFAKDNFADGETITFTSKSME